MWSLGIDAVVDKLREKLPQASIVLVGILPSEISEKKSAADREINRYLAQRYAVDPKVAFLDIAPVFFKDGKLDASIFYDPRLPRPGKALHPDTVGQRLMAEAIEPTLVRLLQDGPAAVPGEPVGGQHRRHSGSPPGDGFLRLV